MDGWLNETRVLDVNRPLWGQQAITFSVRNIGVMSWLSSTQNIPENLFVLRLEVNSDWFPIMRATLLLGLHFLLAEGRIDSGGNLIYRAINAIVEEFIVQQTSVVSVVRYGNETRQSHETVWRLLRNDRKTILFKVLGMSFVTSPAVSFHRSPRLPSAARWSTSKLHHHRNSLPIWFTFPKLSQAPQRPWKNRYRPITSNGTDDAFLSTFEGTKARTTKIVDLLVNENDESVNLATVFHITKERCRLPHQTINYFQIRLRSGLQAFEVY